MRARGLKHKADTEHPGTDYVAPHAGAWIETPSNVVPSLDNNVAPHAGAWIETVTIRLIEAHPCESRPMRARGLKPY